MKNTQDHEKRRNFVSAFTQTPPQFDTFTTTLKDVLDGEQKITELKYSAKKTESLVLGWIDFCDDIGFYAFHTYLLDVFERRQPVVTYIRNMSLDAKTKSIKNLKNLRLQCNKDINVPHAINVCYEMQNEITQILSEANTDVTQNMSQELFQGQEQVFGSDEFFDDLIEHEAEQEKNAAFYKAFMAAIHKKYSFSSKGVPMLKKFFKSAKERLADGNVDR